ncbi:hypothetical protein [Microbacterium sp. VKM Ac-2923]|uniref:hypothetical protein n=1 Tax=Microbacterium sp. VKM Ac-2923 TaxID=2929476 RepID=UPI001FB1FD1D|nr:hypothetical protein [Microbacterium sp. VKM Ac-2923]MCJ1709228.1 hypothetical protein [Microbacterium sp. VKM Ac-2923]
MAKLLNAALLFQTLLADDAPPSATVASDLDVDSFDEIPFVTHSANIAQDGAGPDLWTATLVVNIFAPPRDSFDVAAYLYAAITGWGEDPDAGIVPGVGAVERLDDLNAFVQVSGEVSMVNKIVVHYQGTFTLLVRAY